MDSLRKRSLLLETTLRTAFLLGPMFGNPNAWRWQVEYLPLLLILAFHRIKRSEAPRAHQELMNNDFVGLVHKVKRRPYVTFGGSLFTARGTKIRRFA